MVIGPRRRAPANHPGLLDAVSLNSLSPCFFALLLFGTVRLATRLCIEYGNREENTATQDAPLACPAGYLVSLSLFYSVPSTLAPCAFQFPIRPYSYRTPSTPYRLSQINTEQRRECSNEHEWKSERHKGVGVVGEEFHATPHCGTNCTLFGHNRKTFDRDKIEG